VIVELTIPSLKSRLVFVAMLGLDEIIGICLVSRFKDASSMKSVEHLRDQG